MFIKDQHTPLEPADATMISYTFLRHLGFMLDELSAQGLTLWQDKSQRWCLGLGRNSIPLPARLLVDWGSDRGCGSDTLPGGV